jgi:transcriptional regulator with XRE-family HTH domain
MTAQPENRSAEGPTVLRMLLGAQLRRLREGQGVSREDAGSKIRSSESKISRMELGRVGVKERDLADLLTTYGVNDELERGRLFELARDANRPGWWRRYRDILPDWFRSYLDLEASAALIRTYEVQFVPGLLQTREYARAVVLLGHGRDTPADIELRVDLRMARQELLTRENPRQLWAVIDEAVLRRPIGGRAVLRGQVRALLEATALPNVRLQLIPLHVGGHAGAGGAFTILRFAENDIPDVIYIEQLTGSLYIDRREEVDQYAEAMERLCLQAETPVQTSDSLARILKDLDADHC